MNLFLATLSCIVAEILALIGLFILAYKIPRLFLNHYAKNHNMTLDELLNKHDQFSDLSSSLGALDYLLLAFITSNCFLLICRKLYQTNLWPNLK